MTSVHAPLSELTSYMIEDWQEENNQSIESISLTGSDVKIHTNTTKPKCCDEAYTDVFLRMLLM